RLSGLDQEQALEIRQAAATAGAITRQLLTLSRRDLVHAEVLNINDVVGEVQPLITHSLGKVRTLAMDLSGAAGYIRADRNQLQQVLLNLALNAKDAMPAGGELRIESAITEVDEESPDARFHRPGWYVRLTVRDTGQGMDQSTLARIFEPFFTTKKV